jgi:hypothetical protein
MTVKATFPSMKSWIAWTQSTELGESAPVGI